MGLPERNAPSSTIDDIPADLWQIIELLYFGKLSQAQIAERLHLPLGMVRTRTLLAMRLLRHSLGGAP